MAFVNIRLFHLEPKPMAGPHPGTELWGRDVSIPAAARILIHARSGQGKTTLLSVIYGLRRDYEGLVFFDGQEISRLSSKAWSRLRQRQLSLVFQDLQLFEDLTAWQNVELKNRLTGHKTIEEIARLFEQLGLADKMQVPTSQLSTGQKQRIAIIRALCQPFAFLLLDEPFSHLDPQNIQLAQDMITTECHRQQAGMILTSLTLERHFDFTAVYPL